MNEKARRPSRMILTGNITFGSGLKINSGGTMEGKNVFEWFGKVNFTPHTKVSKFADQLKDGRLMGSRCQACGFETFPPRADCPKCLSDKFEFREISGAGTLLSHVQINAAPTGFEDLAPYRVGLIDLEDGGRLLAWLGESFSKDEIRIGMTCQAVPRVFEEEENIKVYYTLEKPGTVWKKAPRQDN